ncbi:MAG: hypothetical protein ACREOZ_04055, partial [Gloeomargaritales cyanobacterium]
MCGSNAAGETLPIHICFSSDAQDEENYQIKQSWLANCPRVTVSFGHLAPVNLPTTATVNPKGGTDSRVLKQVLIQYIEKLYPDAVDVKARRVVIKIDGGPGRLDQSCRTELRTRGVYLFPGVQNTTHITQETDQNYGLFKSIVRSNTQIILNENIAAHRKGMEAHNADPRNISPPRPVSLDRSDYGIILSGRPADPENGKQEMRKAFELAFSREKNLRSWRICGAVPCTRAPLSHPSVRREVGSGQNVSLGADGRGHGEPLGWASATLEELEKGNENACLALTREGFNGSALRVTLRKKARTLASRLPRDANPEDRVNAIVKNGITLSSLFHTVGPTCVSSDEVFIANEYKLLL